MTVHQSCILPQWIWSTDALIHQPAIGIDRLLAKLSLLSVLNDYLRPIVGPENGKYTICKIGGLLSYVWMDYKSCFEFQIVEKSVSANYVRWTSAVNYHFLMSTSLMWSFVCASYQLTPLWWLCFLDVPRAAGVAIGPSAGGGGAKCDVATPVAANLQPSEPGIWGETTHTLTPTHAHGGTHTYLTHTHMLVQVKQRQSYLSTPTINCLVNSSVIITHVFTELLREVLNASIIGLQFYCLHVFETFCITHVYCVFLCVYNVCVCVSACVCVCVHQMAYRCFTVLWEHSCVGACENPPR